MFFDAKEFHLSTNKEVATILSGATDTNNREGNKAAGNAAQLGEAKWGDEEELDIDDEMMQQNEQIEGDGSEE